MPEGDTVWLAGRRLDASLAGRVLTRTDFRVPTLATVDLSGRAVTEVVSRGKHLLTRVEGGVTIHTHFRMDGSWHLYRHGAPWRGGPLWQVRAVLENAEWQAVGYRLPVLEVVATGAEDSVVGHLGPDVLGPDWDPAEALRRLTADPSREVGQALLDQRVLAGVGNLYKSEVAFLAGVSPWLAVSDLPDPARVIELCERLLAANKDTYRQVTTGDPLPGRQHWVFERDRRPCLRYGTRILTADQGVAPYQRIAYWCPQCQPGPAPRPVSARERARPPLGRSRYAP